MAWAQKLHLAVFFGNLFVRLPLKTVVHRHWLILKTDATWIAIWTLKLAEYIQWTLLIVEYILLFV